MGHEEASSTARKTADTGGGPSETGSRSTGTLLPAQRVLGRHHQHDRREVGLIDPRTLVGVGELALPETSDIALLLRVSLPIIRCPYQVSSTAVEWMFFVIGYVDEELPPICHPVGMRIHDWTGFAALPAIVMTIVELWRGHGGSSLGWAFAALLLGVATRYLALRFPSPMPHRLRWSLLVPRTNQSPAHLCNFLQPYDGERILEIGPGLGIHSVAVARALAPTGELVVVDMQQEMLDEVLQRANRANLTNIVAELGDAQRLAYPDNTFDAAYLLGVLGEIPDVQLALQEVRRVLKPTSRLVVGEVVFDPDCILFGTLNRQTEQAGFVFDRRLGGALSYLARFRPA